VAALSFCLAGKIFGAARHLSGKYELSGPRQEVRFCIRQCVFRATPAYSPCRRALHFRKVAVQEPA
jgi:hypothetical protein